MNKKLSDHTFESEDTPAPVREELPVGKKRLMTQ